MFNTVADRILFSQRYQNTKFKRPYEEKKIITRLSPACSGSVLFLCTFLTYWSNCSHKHYQCRYYGDFVFL